LPQGAPSSATVGDLRVTDRIVLESDGAIVEVLPRLGGSIVAFDLKRGDEKVAIFRRWTGEWENPRALGSSPMVPWFNRISGGGFEFDGAFFPIAPNDPLEPVPIHGDGWLSAWDVAERSRERCVLRLRSATTPPFDYEATQVVSLGGRTLAMRLAVRHLGDAPAPYALGQHPWFVRTPGVTLQATATGVWLEQPPAFPEHPVPASIPREWDFSSPRRLPETFIDNGFAGWDGRARIEWPDRGTAVDIEADGEARYYHVYSLDKDCPIFCFEPVTAPFNALGQPGQPAEKGLRVLARGEETSLDVRYTAQSLARA
jgi:aldose 1-epimerase